MNILPGAHPSPPSVEPTQADKAVVAELERRLSAGAYDGYAYAYPHKSAYRPLEPVALLRDEWAGEEKSALFLYTHLPFCEVRCGFCNLFTSVRPEQSFAAQTLRAIHAQSQAVAQAIEPMGISQAAFGGGTPSFLSTAEITELFATLTSHWRVDWHSIPVSFETSPGTLDPEKLALLRELGVDRLSMGVQSFVPGELKALGRPQRTEQVMQACRWVQDAGFPTFNIDLIYGAASQTVDTWQQSLRIAIQVGPEELYLYPLYVRELTGLAKARRQPAEHRRELYRHARDLLTAAGYEQISMRLFRKPKPGGEPKTAHSAAKATSAPAKDYCCQEDGMVGLGPGARSYTRALHYSSEYAVGQSGVRRIIESFNQRSRYDVADYGVRLSPEEQRRRYVIKSLLRSAGLSLSDYHARFGTQVLADLPELTALLTLGLATLSPSLLQLTAAGLEFSDTIGPWLYSAEVQRMMNAAELT